MSANNALIENCNIADGDDNIAIGGSTGQSSSNVTVENDTFGIGHGLSIGSYTSGGVNGLTVNHVTFNGTTSGIRMKSAVGRGGTVQNLSYSNITMTNVENPIYISSYYPTLPASAAASDATPGADEPLWENISISNLTSVKAPSDGNEGIIWGLPEQYVQGVTLTNVSVTAPHAMEINFANDVNLINSTPNLAISEYDATVTETTPEPSTITLMAAGAGVVLLRRRRSSRC
jgi:hypothetical protein